ncbi:MAG: RHS repeat-associated core domain-containing protein, partial [Chloroflexi bacterium]|nr:RHS repeat-associated core domain-containing protein [Chloroflexota bacterium]
GALRNTPSGGVANDRRFSGEQQDAETGYSFLRARYYDPAIGRFTGRDAVEGGNSYTYTANNPVNLVDPSGYSEDGGDWTPCPSGGCAAIGWNPFTMNSSCGGSATVDCGAGGTSMGSSAVRAQSSGSRGYGYDYSYHLGIPLRVGAAAVMKFFLGNFGRVMPLASNCNSLSYLGQECFLNTGIESFSGDVRLVDMGSRYFSFLAPSRRAALAKHCECKKTWKLFLVGPLTAKDMRSCEEHRLMVEGDVPVRRSRFSCWIFGATAAVAFVLYIVFNKLAVYYLPPEEVEGIFYEFYTYLPLLLTSLIGLFTVIRISSNRWMAVSMVLGALFGSFLFLNFPSPVHSRYYQGPPDAIISLRTAIPQPIPGVGWRLAEADAATLNSVHYGWERRKIHYVSAQELSTGPLVVSVNPIDNDAWGAAALSLRGHCNLLLALQTSPPSLRYRYGVLPDGMPCVGAAANRETVTSTDPSIMRE